MDEWNKIGAKAGRQVSEAHFRQGLPVVIEGEGVTKCEYPDRTFKRTAGYGANQRRATAERRANPGPRGSSWMLWWASA